MFTGNDGPGPYLLIAQGPAENVPPLDVPEAETITPVDIGGADPGSGYQFIYASRKGEWACTEGGINIDLSLTWQREGKQFDVYALGGCAMTEGFTQLDLLKLAEDLTGVSTHLETELDPECLPRADDARQMADFPVLEPKWIPDGLIFDNASYGEWPGYPVVYFYYKISGQPHPDLVISQSPVQLEMGNDLQSKYSDLPQDGYELFEIAGHPAMIQSGSWLLDPNGDLFWYDQGVAETLYWEVDGILISISGPWWADDSGDSKAMLITIAEGME
jgi:hypothetical protein